MRYNLLGYLVGEGYQNALKNKKSTSTCIFSMICSMLLFGFFFSIMLNTNAYLKKIESDQGISVFILDEATQDQVDELEKKIRSIEGVRNVTYKSKEEALQSMKDQMDSEYFEDYGTSRKNPFPASFTVYFTDISKNKEIKEQISTFEFVKDIESSEKTMEFLIKLTDGSQKIFGILSIALVIISIVLINNVIKLSISARGKEISIMKYVGATNSFIRWPFIVEGILLGIVSALISIGLMAFMYIKLGNSVAQNVIFNSMNFNLIPFADLFTELFLIYIFLGIGIGIIGSSTSMKKYLEV